jgi:hypothetical protein
MLTRPVLRGYCPSPLLMHQPCMQHLVTRCAPLPAVDKVDGSPALLTNRSAKLKAITDRAAFHTEVATALAVLSINVVSA